MENSKPVSIPLAGHLGLSMTQFPHSSSVLSRFMANPGREHWNGVKWLLRYVRGSLGVGLKFVSSKEGVGITGHVSWKSQLQSIVALSTTEAEYIAATGAMKEVLWLQGLVKELGVLNSVVEIFSDSQSAIQLLKNQVFHEMTKHVDVRYHFIRENVSSGAVKLEKISTIDNPIDMATKVLPVSKFRYCLDLVQVMCN
ncbi:hypothetical protein AAG906_020238 [Vitis piasezkii]